MSKSLLVIGAHLDECECGPSGTSLKLAKLGYQVVFLNTVGNFRDWSIIHSEEDFEALTREAHEAAALLGARKVFLDYRNNCFPEGDFEARGKIAQVAKKVNPEIVLIHWPKDNHYDHVRTAKASLEALSSINRFAGGEPVDLNLKEIIAYEAGIWQTFGFEPDFYIDVTAEIETAFQSIRAFIHLGEMAEGYVEHKKAQCRLRGLQAGYEYAEAFEHLGPRFPVQSILPEILGDAFRPAGSNGYPWGKRYF